MIVAPFAAMIVQLAISRTREYGADRGGAEICGNPRALASALAKLAEARRAIPSPVARAQPGRRLALHRARAGGRGDSLFSTHPATENRIAALEAMADETRPRIRRRRSARPRRPPPPRQRARSARAARAETGPTRPACRRAAPPCACSTRCCARACRSRPRSTRAARELERADDRAFAHAIAAETLRRLPDLDALIDRATSKRLPDDAKARFALRIALVQALALGTPPHAAISTVLPLVDGGPRRLVHGVFGTVMREKRTLPELPALPAAGRGALAPAPGARRWSPPRRG